MGDFNAELSNNFGENFYGSYSLKKPYKETFIFQKPRYPTCIDLILTNRQKRFQNSTIIKTGLSDFHNLTVTVLKSYFKKTEAQGPYIA